MSRYFGITGFEHAVPRPLGVLLCNLGTPAAPSVGAVRRYLAEFLSDPRVVERPRWWWLPLLYGVVLTTRPRRSAEAYRKIWSPAGSPLLVHSRAQHAGIAERLATRVPGGCAVTLGMRYGEPSIAHAVRALADANVRRLLVVPLYPQYSGPSTASVFDAVFRELQQWRWVPEIRTVGDYHAEPAYIAALAASVREHWARRGRGARLLLSFHGLPRSYVQAGDPYLAQCRETARLLAHALGLAPDEWVLSFQSRVGREDWLEPYTDRTLIAFARDGVRTVDVLCPGFAADCLETLEEIALRNDATFVAHGGEQLRYIPALNARADHLDMLAALILRHAQGWPELAGACAAPQIAADARPVRTPAGAPS